MLHHFLSDHVGGHATSHLFDGLNIASTALMKEQGQHIVLFVTFKDMKQTDYELSILKYRSLMSEIYQQFNYLLSSNKLSDCEKELYRAICLESSALLKLQEALYILTGYLKKHHNKEVWLLMDQYDAPLITAYNYGYYDEMCIFMRGCMSPLVKDNPHIHKAVITGILRVSKENLFSGMNNLKVYSMLEDRYAEHFGFTQSEVDNILEQSGLSDKASEVRDWYNGYYINNVTLYNPWSISQYVDSGGKFDLYWVNTAEDVLLRKMIINSTEDFKVSFEILLAGHCITTPIDLNVTFKKIMGSSSAIWSMLYLSGHLRVLKVEDIHEERQVTFDLPNREIRRLMNHIIYTWISPDDTTEWFRGFIVSLLEGHVDQFKGSLKSIMNQVVSCHDVARTPECFYHGLMMGLTAYLHSHKGYKLLSNRESSKGRFNYMILSNDPDKLSVLFEFKRLESVLLSKPGMNDEGIQTMLKVASETALKQIYDREYTTEAISHGATCVLVVGLAFCGKYFEMTSEMIQLN